MTMSQPITDEELASCIRNIRDGNRLMSTMSRAMKHPDFKMIVALGEPVLPQLFARFARRPNHEELCLLATITGAQPVAKPDRGRWFKIIEAWNQWGRDNGYLPAQSAGGDRTTNPKEAP